MAMRLLFLLQFGLGRSERHDTAVGIESLATGLLQERAAFCFHDATLLVTFRSRRVMAAGI